MKTVKNAIVVFNISLLSLVCIITSTGAALEALPGCSPAVDHTIGQVVTPAIESSCKLIPFTSPAGQALGTICDALAPVVGPIVAAWVESLGKNAELASPTYVFVTYQGEKVGSFRADLAPAIQKELDKK